MVADFQWLAQAFFFREKHKRWGIENSFVIPKYNDSRQLLDNELKFDRQTWIGVLSDFLLGALIQLMSLKWQRLEYRNLRGRSVRLKS